MHSVTIGIMAVVGTGVVALNQSFLKLWVGENFYGGNATNLLLVLVALGIALFRIDSVIIDSMLEFRSKSIAQLVAGIFVILLGSLMLYLWGLPGMACGVMLGYFGLITYLQLLIRRCTGISAREYLKSLARPGFVAISLLCGAHVVPILLRPNSWPSFAGVAVLVALTAASCMWWGGLHNSERTLLARRFSSSFMVLRSVMNRS